jgi:acetolactate synthase-1/2/3 large subunit
MRPITRSCTAIYDAWRSTEVVHQAFGAALGARTGPAYLDLPVDIQLTRISGGQPTIRPPLQRSAMHPDPDAVRDVAARLGAAQQPVVLAGTGAYWARGDDALKALADAAGTPVFLNGMARGMLGRGHPFHVVRGRRQALRGADFVLLLGAEFDFRLGFGQPDVLHPEAFVVQVAADSTRLGANRHVDLPIVSDVGAFVAALVNEAGEFARTAPRRWTVNLVERERAVRLPLDQADSRPVHPLHFVREVTDFLDADATVIGDGGDIVSAFARWFRPGGPGRWLDPGPFGCLGVGAPFAIGARLHRPSAQIAVIFGDGAFGFNAFEYDSAVRQKLPFVGIMGNDGAWGEMRTFHADVFGEYDHSAQYLSQETAYHDVVTALGGYGERVDRASEIQPALRRAFDSGVPALVNVILDPSYRHKNEAVSGRNVALAYGEGDADAFKRS